VSGPEERESKMSTGLSKLLSERSAGMIPWKQAAKPLADHAMILELMKSRPPERDAGSD
jgi:hypothetical protein